MKKMLIMATSVILSGLISFQAKAEVLIGVPPSEESIVIISDSPVMEIKVDSVIEAPKLPIIYAEAKPEKQEIPEKGPEYSDEDFYYLSHLICGEVQYCSKEEQIAVGSVVLNRVSDEDYPDSIKKVVKDKKFGIQYASYYDGNFDRTPTETNEEVAKFLLENGTQIPENVVFQSQVKQGRVWKKIGKHYFCYK